MQEVGEGSSHVHIRGNLVPRLSAAPSPFLNPSYLGTSVLTQMGLVLAQAYMQQDRSVLQLPRNSMQTPPNLFLLLSPHLH